LKLPPFLPHLLGLQGRCQVRASRATLASPYWRQCDSRRRNRIAWLCVAWC
jgi:hypothetical protein